MTTAQVDGTWQNQYGSTLKIERVENDGTLRGTFSPAVGAVRAGSFPVVGVATGDSFAFTVAFGAHGITSWVGHARKPDASVLEATWIMVIGAADVRDPEWKRTLTGADSFRRAELAEVARPRESSAPQGARGGSDRWNAMAVDDSIPPAYRADLAPAVRHPGVSTCWVLPFLYGAILCIESLFWIARGRFFDRGVYLAMSNIPWTALDDAAPAIARLHSSAMRLTGALGLSAGLVFMGVAAAGYRRGERWAWYILWTLPLYATLDLATLAAYRALTLTNAAWDLLLIFLSLAGLLIPYRSFFGGPALRRPYEAARA